jgi:hypothetical protein
MLPVNLTRFTRTVCPSEFLSIFIGAFMDGITLEGIDVTDVVVVEAIGAADDCVFVVVLHEAANIEQITAHVVRIDSKTVKKCFAILFISQFL